ncbi:UvrD-like helicase, ATP-binding domain, P-loop containing nucleoside triphosphate hydrolase [Tanacetum coccineum]
MILMTRIRHGMPLSLITNAFNLHGYAVRSLYKAIQTSGDQETLVRVAVYGVLENMVDMLVNGIGMLDIEDPITVSLLPHNRTNSFVTCRRIKDIVTQSKGSLLLELQQRSIEFDSILEKHQNIRSTLVERMPALDEATYRRAGSISSTCFNLQSKSSQWGCQYNCCSSSRLAKVDKIPLTFESEQHYFGSFKYPLLEETRFELVSSMDIMYRAPFADILSVNESTSGENMLYNVTVGRWRNQCSESGKDDYYTLPGYLLLVVDWKPESFSHMKREGRTWKLALVKSNEGDSASLEFTIKASQRIEFQDGLNLNIVKEVLYSDSKVKEKCSICSFGYDSTVSQKLNPQVLLNLNESQRVAVMSALCKMQCCNISSVEQIWGPPGTGKTMTVSVLLFILLQLKKRSLTCAPTNVAVVQLASRVQSLVRESFKTATARGDYFCSFGDLLLFGSKEILKVSSHSEEIYLEQRVKRLAECLGPVTGKRTMLEMKSFIEYVQERFNSSAPPLRSSLESLLFRNNMVSEELEDLFNSKPLHDDTVCIASGFGRSLFNRLSSLGHSEHLLNVQYRMHPSISFFPYQKFYHNQILDAQNVLSKGYEKRYLSGPMFGSYSFINFVGGREEKDDDGRSRRNMVEVAVVGLWLLRVTFIRIEIREPIGGTHEYTKNGLEIHMTGNLVPGTVEESLQKYEKLDGFSVTVKSIDGFQGGEEDIIILTVLISDEFRRSFGKLIGSRLKKQALNLLLKLSSGWRPKNRILTSSRKNLDVPRTWLASQEIIRFPYLKDSEVESESSVNPDNAITCVDNSKDVDLPMQVNDEQMDIILSRKSSFIIGRSGTGKTTILTMKLFQHEHEFQIASDSIFEAESSRFRYAEVYVMLEIVNRVINNFDNSSSVEVNLDSTYVIPSEFDDTADTSFFERFRKASEDCHVILVRDDRTKTEVCEFVGKNALVLTIVEYKLGLEFQDVRGREKLAKASGLRASAYQMRETNHEAFEGYVREAAGKIYVSTCGKIVAAAECFTLAGYYSEAAEAYAKDN